LNNKDGYMKVFTQDNTNHTFAVPTLLLLTKLLVSSILTISMDQNSHQEMFTPLTSLTLTTTDQLPVLKLIQASHGAKLLENTEWTTQDIQQSMNTTTCQNTAQQLPQTTTDLMVAE